MFSHAKTMYDQALKVSEAMFSFFHIQFIGERSFQRKFLQRVTHFQLLKK